MTAPRLDGRRIAVVTNYLPAAGHAGHTAYFDSIVGAMVGAGAAVTLVLVEPLPMQVVARAPAGVAVRGAGTVQRGGRVCVVTPRAVVRNAALSTLAVLPAGLRRRLFAVRTAVRRRRSHDHVVLRPLAPATVDAARVELEMLRPDVVIVNGHALGTDMVPAGLPVAIIAHDSLTRRCESLRAQGYHPVPATFGPDDERRLLERASLLTAIQPDELEGFRSLVPGVRAVWLPPSFTRPPGVPVPQADRCLFVGSESLHNADGINWFLAEVWPLVLAARPSANLRIVGGVGDRVEVEAVGVEVAGRVRDLAAEYRAAELCVVPLRVGSGLKIKTVEAIVHGCPVVSTSIGAEGLGSLDPSPIAIADRPEELAALVAGLLTDRSAAAHLREAASASAVRFEPSSVAGPFIDELAALCGR